MADSTTGTRESTYTIEEAVALAVAVEGGAVALDIAVGTEEEDFTFSENTENADAATTNLFDLQDGVTANWSTAVGKNVRVVGTIVVDEGTGAGAEEGDTFDLMVAHNEVLVAGSEEGLVELTDTGAPHTFNIDKVIKGVKGGDTLRLIAKGDEGILASTLDIAAAGEFDLMQA